MRSPISALLLALLGASLSCFTGADPLYCESNDDCNSSGRPICDLTGDLPGSGGLGRTCVANSFGECNDDPDCTDPLAPICDSGQCWPCDLVGQDGDVACTNANPNFPVCAAGSCVECAESADCGAGRPICENFQCVTCTEAADAAACEAKDSDVTMCADAGANAGRCVQCESSADCLDPLRPTCASDGMCVGCIEHGDCSSGVCNRESGECVAASLIVYADSTMGKAPPCGDAPGNSACLALHEAVAVTDQMSGRTWVKMAPGTYQSDNADRVILSGGSLQLVGSDSGETAIDGDGANPAITVGEDSSLLVDTVTVKNGEDGINCTVVTGTSSVAVVRSIITDNDAEGFKINNCKLTIAESTIHTNVGLGVSITDGDLDLTRSEIYGNDGGGVKVADSPFQIENNVVYLNGTPGGSGSAVGGINITNSGKSPEMLSFNTIVSNQAATGFAQGVNCQIIPAVEVSSNIVFLKFSGDPLLTGNCTWTYSAIEGGATGTGNISDDPVFVNAASNNYHLQPTSPCQGAADPNATLNVDFDGDARPLGTGRDIGADEIVP